MEETENVRVSDSAERIARGYDERLMWVVYDLGGWIARAQAQIAAPFDGPEEVSVRLDTSEDALVDSITLAEAGGGITAEVLRSVPLNDARKVLRRLRVDALAERDTETYELPERMVSFEDWIQFARAYGKSATRNVHQPVAHLARATGLSTNTLNARIRRAQELGLLTDTGGGWLVLAGQARYEIEEQ